MYHKILNDNSYEEAYKEFQAKGKAFHDSWKNKSEMEDEGGAGDAQQLVPYFEGKNVPIMVEEVVKILRNVYHRKTII